MKRKTNIWILRSGYFSLLILGSVDALRAQQTEARVVASSGNEHNTSLRTEVLHRMNELKALSMAARDKRESGSPDQASEVDESWVLEARFEIRKLILAGAAIEDPVERRRYYSELRRLNASLLNDLAVAESNQNQN